MKTFLAITVAILLSACTGTERPMYLYENTHKLDKELDKGNMCFVIDNDTQTIKKGHKNLSANPFLGQEAYNPANIAKTQMGYDTEYSNSDCKNPIKIKRQIEVSSISYPSTCFGVQYTGSVYTGATSRISPYGTITTQINSVPQYNTNAYSCIKTQYYTNINFYHDKTLVGSIKNNGWSKYNNIDDTIWYFTSSFFNEIKTEHKQGTRKKYCANCFDKCESAWCRLGCSLKQCSPNEI